MSESIDLFVRRTTPNSDTLFMDRGEVVTKGRPTKGTLCPILAFMDQFRRGRGGIQVHVRRVTRECRKEITAIQHPMLQVIFILVRLNQGFSIEMLRRGRVKRDIRNKVHFELMILVELIIVQRLDTSTCVFLVTDIDKTVILVFLDCVIIEKRHFGVGLDHGDDEFLENFFQLFLLFSRHGGDTLQEMSLYYESCEAYRQ